MGIKRTPESVCFIIHNSVSPALYGRRHIPAVIPGHLYKDNKGAIPGAQTDYNLRLL